MPGDADTQRRHELQLDGQDKTLDQIHASVARLAGQIPENFSERFWNVENKVKIIAESLEKQYVSRLEFEVLKVEHTQIKRLVYGFIITVAAAFLGMLLVKLGWK